MLLQNVHRAKRASRAESDPVACFPVLRGLIHARTARSPDLVVDDPWYHSPAYPTTESPNPVRLGSADSVRAGIRAGDNAIGAFMDPLSGVFALRVWLANLH